MRETRERREQVRVSGMEMGREKKGGEKEGRRDEREGVGDGEATFALFVWVTTEVT